MNQTQDPGNVSHPYPMTALIHGRFSGGFGWIAYPNEFMRRSSTALVHDGRVWVIDPVYTTGIDAEIEALGTIAGIILTVGHHDRDAIWFAERYDVPLYVPGNLIAAPKGGPAVRVAGQIPTARFSFCHVVAGVQWHGSRNVPSGGPNTASSSPETPSERQDISLLPTPSVHTPSSASVRRSVS